MTDAPNDQDGAGGPLGQSDIDDLFGGGGGGEEPAAPVEPEGAGALGQSDIDDILGDSATGDQPKAPEVGGLQEISQADIDALMQAAGDAPASASAAAPDPAPDGRVDTLGRPFDDMAAAMQAAIEAEQTAAPPPRSSSSPPPAAAPVPAPPTEAYDLHELSVTLGVPVDPKRMTMLNDVNLNVKIELGRTRMLVEEVLRLGEGSVVELDKLAGDPVDVYVNGRLIARGEVLVLNDNFCVRISEVLTNDPHRVSA